MASDAEDAPWEPSSDAQALAQLRSLIRAYIRGEMAFRAFVLQFGVMSLTHDVATPRPPAKPDTHSYCSDPDCDGHEIGDISQMVLHNPSCGCDWCRADDIVGYRGVPAVDRPTSGSKAEE